MSDRVIPSDFVRRSVELSQRTGSIDLTGAAEAAGISASELADPMHRLTPAQVTAFIQATWQVTGDELFGLAPAPVPRGTFRVICLTLIHTPDLGSALHRIADVLQALPTLAQLRIESGDDTTRLTIDLPGAEGEAGGESATERTRILTDFLLILLHRFGAWLVGKRLRLHSVELPYPQPERVHLAENYDHIFGVPVIFGAELPALEISNAALSAPIIQTEESLEEYLRHSPNLMLSERDYESTASAQVRRVLETGVKGRTSTAEEISALLSISVPHLRRLLRQEGTSLNLLREEV
ncbi:MAG: AraC family transcriptional regulator, partial [Rhodococcus sp.]|nr:AraC family transcriptional regulator [Rhodococcus sp. (in: high G+C Gram-positive bacteria)]